MDLRDSVETANFRSQVKAWLVENLPPHWDASAARDLSVADRWLLFGRGWERKLFEAGLNGVSWPQDSGGQGLSILEEIVLLEELAIVDVPESINSIAKTMLGPTMIIHGDQMQRSRFLPAILRGEHIWCQGFSEPDAGSDLAALRTKAVRVNGGWRLSGQKIWTSHAARADWMFALVRSDPEAERHSGLSLMLVDLASDGVEVRPLPQINGEADFNEVFLDQVFVPDENVVGEPGDGWAIARTLLGFERGAAHFGRHIRFRRQLGEILEMLKAMKTDEANLAASTYYRDRLMRVLAEVEIYRLMAYRHLSSMLSRQVGSEGSVIKLFWNEMYQELQSVAMELLGVYGYDWHGEHFNTSQWPRRYLYSLSRTIAGGTSEIQRNIVGERLLGLPR